MWPKSSDSGAKALEGRLTGLWAAELLLIVIYIALGIPVMAEDTKPPSDAVPAVVSTQTQKQMEHWGSVNPENLPSMFSLTDFRGWLEQHRVRHYGWIDAGGQHASTGSGELELGFPTVILRSKRRVTTQTTTQKCRTRRCSARKSLFWWS